MSSETKALVRHAIEEVFNQKNIGIIASLYAPDFRGSSPYGPIEGRDALKSFCENFVAGFPDFHIQAEQVIADDEWVAVPYTFIGTNSGPFAGFPPTGCVVESQGVLLMRIVNNSIIEQCFVWDDLSPRRRVRQSLIAAQRLSEQVSQQPLRLLK